MISYVLVFLAVASATYGDGYGYGSYIATDDTSSTEATTGVEIHPSPAVDPLPYLNFDQIRNYSSRVDVSNVTLTFKMYVPTIINGFQIITLDHLNEIYTDFGKHVQYKILLHGWKYNVTDSWYEETVAEYMKKGGINVITVEYPDVDTLPYYGTGKWLKMAGKEIAKIIVGLNEIKGVPLENIHLIGHSTGAHVAGAAARNVEMMTGLKIGRITGLDPATMQFMYWSWHLQLRAESADFVDIIHTSLIGLHYPMGTVDFYPNGGINQTGCNEAVFCEHMLAAKLFATSINNDAQFRALRCDNYMDYLDGNCDDYMRVYMGENVEQENTNGAFYLETDDSLCEDIPQDISVPEYDKSNRYFPYQYYDY